MRKQTGATLGIGADAQWCWGVVHTRADTRRATTRPALPAQAIVGEASSNTYTGVYTFVR